MDEIGGRAEHQWTAAVDHGEAVLAAVLGGRLRDAAPTGAVVHPDVLDAELGAFAHRSLGELRPGRDHHGVDASGNGGQIAVGAIALHLGGVRVHREDLVATISQALVDAVAPVRLGRARYTRDRHPLVGEKRSCCLVHALHRFLRSAHRTSVRTTAAKNTLWAECTAIPIQALW